MAACQQTGVVGNQCSIAHIVLNRLVHDTTLFPAGLNQTFDWFAWPITGFRQ